ncbi:hypothetical protein [Plantactinospora sp. KBS50]|uniref:hypothetical protein n=1 Tax=Plantactinospora sp. KBS50 TaxID=2024580 RepID=UPI0012FD6A58|nr:hypothetical protein [Plantactinospora sp. KBS50]
MFDRPRHHVDGATVAARVAEQFATGPPRWPGARWHSPDLMVVADDPESLRRGDVDVVLGELHCATNTLETRLFVAQHPDPDRLRATATASGLDPRISFIPRSDAEVPSRISWATELQLPGYTYVSVGAESIEPPAGATTLSAFDLVARSGEHGRVTVTHPGRGLAYDFVEVVGELLGLMIVNAFRVVGAARHRPRITVDRLVLCRESWAFPAAEASWAFVRDEPRRYRQARRWRAERGLPERAFFRVPVERKPMAVDFRSLPLVNLLAKAIRRTAEAEAVAGPDADADAGTVVLTEMLPDLDQLWLADAQGARYTAELRMVAVRDPR